MLIRLADLCLDLQSPSELQPDVVATYVQRLESGAALAPIRVYADGRTFWVLDGHHRVAALRSKGIVEVDAELLHGTYEHLRDTLRDCVGQLFNQQAVLTGVEQIWPRVRDCDPLSMLRAERRREQQGREVVDRELDSYRDRLRRELDAIVDAIT